MNNSEERKNYFINFEKLKKLNGQYPKTINGIFDCSYNNLITLEGSPKIVNGDYDCSFNNLTSLKGCAKEIKGSFSFSENPDLKNVKEQIIKYGIKAKYYFGDNDVFEFKDIKEEFEIQKKEISNNYLEI